MHPQASILIADDHPVVRKGLVQTIRKYTAFRIVAECGNGKETLQNIIELKPDITLMDISMPQLDGLEIIRKTRAEKIITKFIILTMYSDSEYFEIALNLGVKGYLLKDNAMNEIINCLQAVVQGKSYFCPAFSDTLIQHSGYQDQLQKPKTELEQLTTAERHVLKLIAEGKTSRQIAEELFLSVRTVQNHRYHICRKLNIIGYNKLLLFALEHKEVI